MAVDILGNIKKGKIAPMYFLAGERYPQERVVEALRAALLSGGENDFNFESLHAKEDGPSAVLSAARTMSLLGGTKLVLVREAHLFKAAQLNEMLRYIEDPSPRSCVVFLASKADTRLKFFKVFKKKGVFQKDKPLRDREVPKWVTAEARRLKIKLEPRAAHRVADSIGTDKGQLAMALEQLSIYVGQGEPVGSRDVEELLAQTRERSIFDLTNAVGRGQRREALAVLKRMLESREPGVRILVMLTRHVRHLWSAAEMSSQRVGKDAIAKQIGVPAFFVGDIINQGNRIGQKTLRRMHRALFEADRAIKSSRLSDAVILERLVLSLCPV